MYFKVSKSGVSSEEGNFIASETDACHFLGLFLGLFSIKNRRIGENPVENAPNLGAWSTREGHMICLKVEKCVF